MKEIIHASGHEDEKCFLFDVLHQILNSKVIRKKKKITISFFFLLFFLRRRVKIIANIQRFLLISIVIVLFCYDQI